MNENNGQENSQQSQMNDDNGKDLIFDRSLPWSSEKTPRNLDLAAMGAVGASLLALSLLATRTRNGKNVLNKSKDIFKTKKE